MEFISSMPGVSTVESGMGVFDSVMSERPHRPNACGVMHDETAGVLDDSAISSLHCSSSLNGLGR